ncbi:MAG TPA: Uma2 family endonuclease [Blastocatellia bacterium]|nr:Uma2 family endonuclease [Blastocatellia bacterium]
MGLPARIQNYYTVEEYLELEKTSEIRHEYVEGQIYAMSGASKRHNRLAGRIYARLERLLGISQCQPYMNEVKVRIHPRLYYYPDVVVTCEEPAEDPDDDYDIADPILIVEVLSPSTQDIDNREKKIAYQTLNALREYFIVSQTTMRVEAYRHQNPGEEWQVRLYTDPNDIITFESVELSLSLAEIYEGIRLKRNPEGEPNQ